MIAEIAKHEIGALTVGVVTRPFTSRAPSARARPSEGIERLREQVDTLIVIPNEKLLTIVERRTSILDAFREADNVLRQGVQGITDLITIPGLINLDFADVRTIMHDAGSALMGIGAAVGENRAAEAAKSAISSPLLEESVEGATGILLNITGGGDLGLFEVNEAAEIVQRPPTPNANIIFGAVIDEGCGDEVRVTVIATGFDKARAAAAGVDRAARADREARPDRELARRTTDRHQSPNTPTRHRQDGPDDWGADRQSFPKTISQPRASCRPVRRPSERIRGDQPRAGPAAPRRVLVRRARTAAAGSRSGTAASRSGARRPPPPHLHCGVRPL